MSVGRQLERHLRYPVAALCAYETYAIMTNQVPTLSHIAVRHKVLIPVLVGGLAIHLLWPHKVEGTTILVENA